jgi:hypothetical protein
MQEFGFYGHFVVRGYALYFFTSFLIWLTSFATLALADLSLEDCKAVLKTAQDRRETLLKYNESFEFLLESKGMPLIPTQSLFQIDLKKDESVRKRINELLPVSKREQLLLTSENEQYVECAASSKNTSTNNNLVNDVLSQQARLNTQKIAFLSLPKDQRLVLLASYDSQRKQIDNTSELQTQMQKSSQAIEKAKTSLLISEGQSAKGVSPEWEPLLAAKSDLEQKSIDLEKEQVEFIKTLTSKDSVLTRLQSQINQLLTAKTSRDSQALSSLYFEVARIWRTSADELFEIYRGLDLGISTDVPAPIGLKPKDPEVQKNYDAYLASLNELTERKKTLAEDRLKFANALKAQNFQLLIDAGTFRAKLIEECDAIECERARGISAENLYDLKTEIQLVPFMLIAGAISKSLEVKSKFSSGIDGWLDLFKQLIIFVILIMTPFGLYKSLRWVSVQMDQVRKNLLSRSMMDYRRRTAIATWISRLSPFVPSLGMVLAVHIARMLLENTDLKDLSRALYYAEAYFVYRLLRNLLVIGLEILFSTQSVDRIKTQKAKIEQLAAQISRLIFAEYILLHLTEDAVRKAFAYAILARLIFWVNTGFFLYVSYLWRLEIMDSFSQRFPTIYRRLLPFENKKYFALIPPILFFLVIGHDLFKSVSAYLIKIDLVKRLLSEVLRKKLEQVEREKGPSGKPPADYLMAFDYYLAANETIYLAPESSSPKVLVPIMKDWAAGKMTDDLAIIIGNRGMGKSTALAEIHRQAKDIGTIHASRIPTRTLSLEKLYAWLSDVMGLEIRSIDDIARWDVSLESRHFFLVDDIHNLFLAKIGGFIAYIAFLEIISLRTKNMFWCLTVNSRSWAFLKGVFGNEHFYGKEIQLQAWTDSEIQKLVLLRHNTTKYERSFDESIKAYGAGDALGQQAEAQFFRLLWGQSRGNPRSALMYWVSALSSPENGVIHVGIPSFVSSNLVATMSDESLFLLAAISRHESLSHDEMGEVTGIQKSVIRKFLKEARDKGLVWFDEAERVRVSSRAQYVIDYFLVGKNFLYE